MKRKQSAVYEEIVLGLGLRCGEVGNRNENFEYVISGFIIFEAFIKSLDEHVFWNWFYTEAWTHDNNLC